METKLAMLLTLPYKHGGYGLIAPEMNSQIIPAKTAKRSVGKKYYSCDLFWHDYDLAVEYDSDLFHTGTTRIANDSKRRNALTALALPLLRLPGSK